MNLRAIGAVDVRRTPDGYEIGLLDWGHDTQWVCSCAAFRTNARWKDDPRCRHTDAASKSRTSTVV